MWQLLYGRSGNQKKEAISLLPYDNQSRAIAILFYIIFSRFSTDFSYLLVVAVEALLSLGFCLGCPSSYWQKLYAAVANKIKLKWGLGCGNNFRLCKRRSPVST
ncbi:MAG: hypothetical protein AB4352_17930 [Hormoscilla sp.]